MGYTLLDTLSELWFTQFFNSVLLCTCLLVSRVSFLFFTCFCFQRKAEEFFLFWYFDTNFLGLFVLKKHFGKYSGKD